MNNSNNFYINKNLYYTIKRIKNRIIHIPCEELKSEQKYFLNAIKWVYPYSTDTLKSAQIHSGKKWILKLDIKDFFNSVPFRDIEKAIAKVCERIKREDYFIKYLVLVTINGKLPTGVPTSLHLANACFKEIDKKILKICSLFNVDYTRYVDDLTFSSYSKETLKSVENRVIGLLKSYGYNLNKKKTKYISENKQQNILGLVVNGYRVRLPKDFRRRIRAMLHSFAANKCNSNYKAIKNIAWTEQREHQLAGYISYIKHTDKNFYNKLIKYAIKLEQKYYIKFPFLKTK